MFFKQRVLSPIRVLASFIAVLFAVGGAVVKPSQAIPASTGYSSTDFIVAGYTGDRIAVYDQNFNFKGYLDPYFEGVEGLDIMPNGNVIASGLNNDQQVRQYDATGAKVNSFTNVAVGDPYEIKVGQNNLLYLATDSTTYSVQEFNPNGTPLRKFGAKEYYAVAVLPNGTLWATGENVSGIDVYSLTTGLLIKNIPYDNGQGTAFSLTYDSRANTVLMTDAFSEAVYERNLNGTYKNKYILPDSESMNQSYGVTRGPNGNIYATDYTADKVYSWNSSGAYLGALLISTTADGPCNIIWMGNATTPNSSVNATGTLKNANGSIQASLWAANNKNGLGGSLSYTDKYNKTTIQSTKVTTIIVDGNQARVSGECKVNGEAGYTFTAIANDYYATFFGRGDSLQLEVSNGYSGGGIFNPGDVKVTGAPVNMIN